MRAGRRVARALPGERHAGGAHRGRARAGIAERLEQARQRSPSRAEITLRRLHRVAGEGSPLQLATSP